MKTVIFGGESDMASDIAEVFNKDGHVVHALPRQEADVCDYPSVVRAVNYYKPDLLINLAGVSHLQSINQSVAENWVEEVNTNLIGAYNVARIGAAKDLMMIFIGSVAGLYGKPNHSGYCASKAGVISLVQSLAMEKFNAYCISPGRVNTKMREKDFPGEDPETRLTTKQVAGIVEKIIAGEFLPGDNIILRKKGKNTYLKVDKGEPWKEWLQVGQPVV